MQRLIDTDFASVSELVRLRMEELEVPSIAIGVHIAGDIAYEEAFGYADLENGILATTTTPYSIASITKPMVGTALAILKERGKLKLWESADTYLGDTNLRAWEGSAEDATVARLANHTSGLPMYFQFFFEDEPIQPPSSAETIRRYANIVRPPGESYVYSNIGYGVLGHIIEEIARKPLRRVFDEEIFGPLAMLNAILSPTARELHTCAARYDKDGFRLPHYVTDHPGASEAYASVRDLLEFGASHFGLCDSAILSQRATLEMQMPLGPLPCEQHYGLGWSVRPTKVGDRVVSHSGGMDGVSTRLAFLPEQELAITVLSNFDSPLVSEVMTQIYAELGIQFEESTPAEASTTPPDGSIGTWHGEVDTFEGVCPISLSIGSDGAIGVSLYDELVESDASFEDRNIRGSVQAQINNSDALRTSHSLLLDLVFRGDRISGAVTARSCEGPRVGNALAFPARFELRA